jgi:hypothetical protein
LGSVETLVNLAGLLFEHFARVFDDVFFLDVSEVFTSKLISDRPDNNKAYHMLPVEFKVVCPKSLSELKDFLRSNDIVAISYFSEYWPDWYIHYYLKKYSIPLVYVHTTSELISIGHDNPQGKKFLARLWSRFLRKLRFLSLSVFHCFTPYDFFGDIFVRVDTLFISNKEKAEYKKNYRRYGEIVLTNSRFYDNMLVNNCGVSNDYVVFLDSMLPYHLDQVHLGLKLVDRQSYYSNLNGVLDVIESTLAKEAVVCLHPKYNDENLSEDFGKRKTIKYKTDEYVAKAEVVLFHESSAVNSAIVYGKKVIQLTGRDFNDFTKGNCEFYQRLFSFPTLDIYENDRDCIEQVVKNVKVDREKYDSFLSTYIVASGQKGVSSCEQIANHISRKYGIPKKDGN